MSSSKPSLSQLAAKLATFNSSRAANYFELSALPQQSSKGLTNNVLSQDLVEATRDSIPDTSYHAPEGCLHFRCLPLKSVICQQ